MLSKYSLPAVAVLIAVLSWTAVLNKNRDVSYDEKKEMIVMRNIGHMLLLQSGDSTSRVLPVQQVSSTEFRLSFESNFSFKTDSLVELVKQQVHKAGLPGEYIVNMLDCRAKHVLYGFAIEGKKSNDIIACKGRQQVKACYVLQLVFPPKTSNAWLYIVALISLGGPGLYYVWQRKRKTPPVQALAEVQTFMTAEPLEETPKIQKTTLEIGRFAFDPVKQELIIEEQVIALTAKETKVLGILSATVNEVVDRSVLLKLVWEDEGVITGRSLDMFISKLRKKLQADENVSIINIHGKGYKLCVSSKELV